ncbi:MAG: membrane dipeptidase [Bacteroidetes bacterium]|nr:MAG: membrane dipeptidase [Bacteroidota bacterium]
MNFKNLFFALIIIGVTISCSSPESSKVLTDAEIAAKADSLAHANIIVDGHVDIPYRLRNHYEDISVRTEGGHFDYVRAKEGGLDAPFMSIYIPSNIENNGAKALADSLIDSVEKLVADFPDKFALANSPEDIEAQFAEGLISLPMGMENGSPLEGDIGNVEYFYNRGIRYITLTHAKDNHICDSSYDSTYTWNGLSPFGEQVIAEMNRVGIIVDVSHITDSTFYDVIKLSKAPVFASHSSCRYFTPGFERNMPDDMIKILAEHDGVIQLTFGSFFLDSAFINKADDDTLAFTTMEMVADHIDHVVEVAGIDHVGFGSDFDGVSSVPRGLEDASEIPNLIAELIKRGYSDEDIAKICYKNTFRVWRAVESYAKQNQ